MPSLAISLAENGGWDVAVMGFTARLDELYILIFICAFINI
jgi:hypothetical protein